MSWAGGSGEISLGRRSLLGPPAVLGAVVFVVAVDVIILLVVIAAAAVFDHTHGMGVDGRIACSASAVFCYDDPVPDIDTARLAMVVIGVSLVASMLVSVLARRGVIVVLICQGLLLALTLTQGLAALHAGEHRQNELRACHYGAAGNCPGIVNLDQPT